MVYAFVSIHSMAILPKYVGSIRDEIILKIIEAKGPVSTRDICGFFPERDPAMIRMLLSGYNRCESNPIFRVKRALYDVRGRMGDIRYE